MLCSLWFGEKALFVVFDLDEIAIKFLFDEDAPSSVELRYCQLPIFGCDDEFVGRVRSDVVPCLVVRRPYLKVMEPEGMRFVIAFVVYVASRCGDVVLENE
jgi:hypothetical protein